MTHNFINTCDNFIHVQLFMHMGLPHVILSDNGGEFNNQLDDLLSDLLGIKRRLTTPYHPQVIVNNRIH